VFKNFSLSSSTNLNSVSLQSLEEVGGSITFNALNSLSSLSLNNLKSCGNLTVTNNAFLSSVTLPSAGILKNIGNVSFANNALTQTSIDHIISTLVSLDGNNNTTLFGSGKTVNLTGGSNASPSSISTTTTAGSNFVCSSTTCNVNWTNHGYSTNDVLFISGITMATNANKYALITVIDSNRFTYPITPQNATGQGTATVKKANNNIKTLVTRGVILTTK
jgi:hypothetical protein